MDPCNAAQSIMIGLEDLASNCVVGGLQTPNGFAEALQDPRNTTAGSSIIQRAGDPNQRGHRRAVDFYYKQRKCLSDISDTPSCQPCPEKDYLCATFDNLQYRELCISIDEATIRKLSEMHSDLSTIQTNGWSDEWHQNQYNNLQVMRPMLDDLRMDLDALRTQINLDLINEALACAGVWEDGQALPNFDLLCQGANCGQGMNTAGHLALMRQLRRLNCPDRMFAVGDGGLMDYMILKEFGCCNENGININATNNRSPFEFYNDIHYGTAAGNTDEFISWYPGSMQFVGAYNENVANFNSAYGGGTLRGTMPDSEWPIDWDFKLIPPDQCTTTWTLIVGKWFGLFCLPTDLYSNCDRLAGINGIFQGVAQAA